MKEKILAFLPGNHPGQALLHYESCVDSTNTRLKALALQGAPEGTAVIAGMQTGGKGRMGRQFHSPDGKGAYLSFLLRPNCKPQALMHLTCAVAVAMCQAIAKTCGITPQVKWINDLAFGGKKLGGVLTELSILPNTGLVDFAIVGVGINCLQNDGDFPENLQTIATSLSVAAKKAVDPFMLCANMIESLWEMKENLLSQKMNYMTKYRANCLTLGQDVKLIRDEQSQLGKALDIADDGALIVQLSDGMITQVSSGEVQVRGLYGYT